MRGRRYDYRLEDDVDRGGVQEQISLYSFF